jgi:hypothetical protein
MKLFYHFLVIVFASLILVACANLFATDPKNQSQTDEFPSADHAFDGQEVDDSTVASNAGNPFVLTALKANTPLYLNSALAMEHGLVNKEHAYFGHFQMALHRFASPKKFK